MQLAVKVSQLIKQFMYNSILSTMIYFDFLVSFVYVPQFDTNIGEDVSENKDEGVIRSQLQKGDGYLTPKEGATCEGKAFLLFLCSDSYACFHVMQSRKRSYLS